MSQDYSKKNAIGAMRFGLALAIILQHISTSKPDFGREALSEIEAFSAEFSEEGMMYERRGLTRILSTGQVAPILPFRQKDLLSSDDTIRFRVGRQDAPIETMTSLNPLQRIYANQPCDPRLPGGPHAAGLQTLMADASVRTFGWDSSPWEFWRACSPAAPVEDQ